MTPGVLLVHGWGLDSRLWDAVAERLPLPCTRLDFGYFGAARAEAPPPGRYIAVGHSFGGLWLLRHWPDGCAGLVAINGFSRFTAAHDFPEGVALRTQDRMIQRFAETPDAVAAAFLVRCGAAAPSATIRPEPAIADLIALRDGDERARCAALRVPVVALCAGDDPIAPPALTRASLPGARVTVLPKGGHLLPLTDPDACARAVVDLAAEARG